MIRRAALLVLVAAVAPVFLSSAAPAGSTGAGLFVVRPDARACPAPLCGGYWVALANRARTSCADGLRRQRCYVARAVDARGRPLASAVPDEALVRGSLGPGRDDLGVLVVADVFAPAGRVRAAGRYLRVVDTGVRCVRSPCFSLLARTLNAPARTPFSGADLSGAGLRPSELERAAAALAAPGGLLVRGRPVETSEGGVVLRATRAFLREPRPRA